MGRRTWSLLPEPVVTRSQRLWRLEQEFVFFDPISKVRHIVPQGFRFRASVPRILWSVFSPEDIGMVAAMMHDWLYQFGGEPPLEMIDPDMKYTRADVDRLLYVVSLMEGRSVAYAWAAWRAVSWFAGGSWRGR